MKRKTIEFFKLKRQKDKTFGTGYVFYIANRYWVKDATALLYNFKAIEEWARNMQELLIKEEKL